MKFKENDDQYQLRLYMTIFRLFDWGLIKLVKRLYLHWNVLIKSVLNLYLLTWLQKWAFIMRIADSPRQLKWSDLAGIKCHGIPFWAASDNIYSWFCKVNSWISFDFLFAPASIPTLSEYIWRGISHLAAKRLKWKEVRSDTSIQLSLQSTRIALTNKIVTTFSTLF